MQIITLRPTSENLKFVSLSMKSSAVVRFLRMYFSLRNEYTMSSPCRGLAFTGVGICVDGGVGSD